MAILNYTTKIDASKTVMEIQKILASKKALSINIDYDETGNPIALTFLMIVNNKTINFRLPSSHEGVFKRIKSDNKIHRSFKTEEQAMRVSWRIIKDWVEAQMALIEADLAELGEIFLPYAVTPSGATLFQLLKNNDMRLLTNEASNDNR